MSGANVERESDQPVGYLPCKLAALIAVMVGVLMILMGGGHLQAVISVAMAQGDPLDYRMVSLITTGVMLAFPGLLSIVVCYWLWRGKNWAYAMCIISTLILMIYLSLLLFAQALDPAKVGSELNAAATVVGSYLVVLIAVWVSMRIRRR
jgi:hypothetical protein